MSTNHVIPQDVEEQIRSAAEKLENLAGSTTPEVLASVLRRLAQNLLTDLDYADKELSNTLKELEVRNPTREVSR